MDASTMYHPKRVLFLITILAVGGGAESQVVRLATEMRARGWDVSVVSMVYPKGHKDLISYESILLQHHIQAYTLNMKAGTPDPRALFRLRSIIKDFRPNVVHCHMYHANILGRITRLICRIPKLICTAHNLKESSRSEGPTWHKELLYRFTDRLADQTTIICKAGFERYLRVRAVPRDKLQVIPNGIDMDLFTRSERRRTKTRNSLGIGSEFVWLVVGRFVKQKDYPTLFRALAMMERRDFIVLIAGSGPLDKQIREECTRLGLDGCVRFCGTREDMLALYDTADAFLMSSKFEGLSMALLEAASMELPAVVTSVGGNPEIVIDGITGYLVPPAAQAQLAAAMQRLQAASPESRKAMGLAARQHCRDHYDISVVMNQWLQLYGEGIQVPPVQKRSPIPAST